MPLTYEHVGSKKPAKINTYMLTRAELLITLCYEIPCNLKQGIDRKKSTDNSYYTLHMAYLAKICINNLSNCHILSNIHT